MKNKTLSLLILLVSITSFGQIKKDWGPKFDYDQKRETDLKVVLVDNYNHFMVSVINIDGGMTPTNQIIIRKFDQKNQLVNTFVEEFPYKDVYTLHNYLGSFELGTDKLVIFTDCYSNKTKKKEIHKIIFDKKTNAFTKTLVAEYTFESLVKSGTVYVIPSQNKNYIGIIYSKFANKKIAEDNDCILLDGKTSDIVWQKNISFPLLSFTESIVTSNSGKFVFIRNSKETGSKNIIAIADANTIENKELGEDLKIRNPVSFSIGTQDYLIAFNNKTHGFSINSGDYGKILLYDLNLGKILKNNTVIGFDVITKIQKINYDYVNIQNNEIHLFVDCYYQTGTKPDPAYPNFTLPVFTFGNPHLLVFSMDGELKNNISLGYATNHSLIKSIGLVNAKGEYYFSSTIYDGVRSDFHDGFSKLIAPDFKKTILFGFNYKLEPSAYSDGSVINQFCNYFPDSKRLLLAKSFNNGKIAFVNISGLDIQ